MLFNKIKLIDRDYAVRSDMYLRTEGAFITYIGESAPEPIEGEETYDGHDKLLIPGLYDTHCHVPMTLLRGYGEGLPLSRWLNERVFPFEAKLTPRDIYYSTKLGAMELLASGTVSLSDMYFSIEDMARSLSECGMKANICAGISSADLDERLSDNSGFKDTVSLAEQVRRGTYTIDGGDPASDTLIKADMGLHAEYTSHEGLVREVAAAAAELGLIVHVHVSETESEHAECKLRHGGRTPVKYFFDAGIFDNPALCAHCIHIEEEDEEILKESGAYLIHNPSSNMKLASGFAPVKRWLALGLNVGLGTDGASSNNNLNMMEEMHVAALIARGYTGDANAVSPGDILKMATRTGALAQGRSDSGLIDTGFRADLAVVDISGPHMQPDFDTLSNLIFAAQSSDVVLTMVDGRTVYRDGEFCFIDKERVICEAHKSLRRILGEL